MVLNSEEVVEEREKSKLAYLILSIAGVLILGSIYYYRRLRNRIVNKILDKNDMIQLKEVEISKLEEKNIELENQINDAFEEVILLAKENSPNFLKRFEEVYPEFFTKLNQIEPKLLNTEKRFCGYLFLQFSTKDIANYTFVTVKAVQHSKYRLRKKLAIPSDCDIITWIDENALKVNA